MASLVIRSPHTRIGTAGGQLTEGAASTRPRASSIGTVSLGPRMAFRMDRTRSPLGIVRAGRAPAGFVYAMAMASDTFWISSSVVFPETMSTT